jgi:phosphonate transport system substrate-binding protein
LALAFGLIAATSAEAKVTLVFGAYTSEKPLTMVRQLRPSLNVIAARLAYLLGEKVEIKLEVTKTYVEGIALLTSGRADFMRLGPASYVGAMQTNPDLQLLAVENKKGNKEHSGVICVNSANNIADVSQLRGGSVAFGNSRSTLGRYFAQQLLMGEGIYARDLSQYDYLDRHDRVGQAVGSGLYDAGALSKSTFKKLVAKGVPIRALATFSSITKAWAAREGFDTRVYEALRTTLLDLDDPAALKALRIDGFLEAADADFQAVRDAIKVNPQFFTDKSTASTNG